MNPGRCWQPLIVMSLVVAGLTASTNSGASESPAVPQATVLQETAPTVVGAPGVGGAALPNPRIVGGQAVDIDDHRYQVRLRIDTGVRILGCGGALVSHEWIVTAAHCLESAQRIHVGYGSARRSEHLGDLHRSAADWVTHPSYDPATKRNDIALVRVAPAVDPRYSAILPIRDTGPAPDRTPAFVTGWGAVQSGGSPVEELRGAAVYIDESCGSWADSVIDVATMLCAPGGYGIDSCQGDSGGPLVTDENGVLQLTGIVSFNSRRRCETDSLPGVYVRAAAFASWIESHTGPLGGTTETHQAAAQPRPSGYWMLSADGRVFTVGDLDAMDGPSSGLWPGEAMVDLAADPSDRGAWALTDRGRVLALGGAPQFGDLTGGPNVAGTASSIASSPDGHGYWIFTTAGDVRGFGTARAFGDLTHLRLDGPVVDSSATPTGLGYYMLGSDGGVFTFGDATFSGSLGGVELDESAVGLVPDPDGSGYWFVAADGGVFAFDAPFAGSVPMVLPGTTLDSPVRSMVPSGDAYVMVAGDGGVFDFSGSEFAGSLAGSDIGSPIVAIAGPGR